MTTTMGGRRTGRAVAPQPTAGVLHGLLLLTGLWLLLSPWLVGFDGLSQLAVSNTVSGLALALLAVGDAVAFDRMRGVSWVLPVIGIWVALSPLAIYHHWVPGLMPSVWIANAVTGGIVLLAGAGVTALSLGRDLGKDLGRSRRN